MINESEILEKMAEEQRKAWDALGRYKFLMFGYHAACWVNLRKMLSSKPNNPFGELVDLAREKRRQMNDTEHY